MLRTLALTKNKVILRSMLLMSMLIICSTILAVICDFRNSWYNNNADFVYAQTSGSKIQTWTDRENNVQIRFSYMPPTPVIDKPTDLRFSVTNLTTGNYLNNLLARVVVTNGQRSFKFTNVPVRGGTFSVTYLFPDTGTYQSIARIDSKNFSTLVSFPVFVPFQPSFGLPSYNIYWIIVAILATSIVVIILLAIIGKKHKKQYDNR